MINSIEDDSFAILLSLEALDLSGNGLHDVPPEVFNLPLLRNLYIADNSFTDRGFESLQKVDKPMKAPLQILSIANNRLFKIPDFGILPELYKLNLSSNSMRDLTPQQFSPFCNIKEVDLNNTSMEKCRCDEVTRFLFRKRDAFLSSSFYCDAISSGKSRFTFFRLSGWSRNLKFFRMSLRCQQDLHRVGRFPRVSKHPTSCHRTSASTAYLGHHRCPCHWFPDLLHQLPLLHSSIQRSKYAQERNSQQPECESHYSVTVGTRGSGWWNC